MNQVTECTGKETKLWNIGRSIALRKGLFELPHPGAPGSHNILGRESQGSRPAPSCSMPGPYYEYGWWCRSALKFRQQSWRTSAGLGLPGWRRTGGAPREPLEPQVLYKLGVCARVCAQGHADVCNCSQGTSAGIAKCTLQDASMSCRMHSGGELAGSDCAGCRLLAGLPLLWPGTNLLFSLRV